MQRSTDRILTTHVGSLIRPPELQDFLRAKQKGERLRRRPPTTRCLTESVADGGAPAGRGRHRRRQRRRVRQGDQLVAIRARAAERLRAAAVQAGRATRSPARRRPRAFAEFYAELDARDGVATTTGFRLRRPDQLHRAGAAPARHRQLQGGAEGREGRRGASCRWRRRRASSPTARTSTTRARRSCSEAIGEAMRAEYKQIVDAGFLRAARRRARRRHLRPHGAAGELRTTIASWLGAAGRGAQPRDRGHAAENASATTSAGEAGPARTPPTCR